VSLRGENEFCSVSEFKSQIQNKKFLAASAQPGISFGIAVLSPTFKLISLGSPKARASLPQLSFRMELFSFSLF
jgi:hypothetical protein